MDVSPKASQLFWAQDAWKFLRNRVITTSQTRVATKALKQLNKSEELIFFKIVRTREKNQVNSRKGIWEAWDPLQRWVNNS